MSTIERNNSLVDGYLRLLENLEPSVKIDLIAKLSISLKGDIDNEKKDFYAAFGKWESAETAEQLISLIEASRNFNRQRQEM
ncbi:MAG: hypothetical protein ACK4XY_03005 [Chloroherpetonaceae bacterium]